MKVSIVTISFNQARFLEKAIQSVLTQDYPDIEYIVVDPGSSDGSREIIEKYREQIDHIIFEPDAGPADGLNKGFSKATGEIMGFINSDDFFLPGAVNTIVDQFMKRPDVDVLSGHAIVVDEQGNVIRRTYSDMFSLQRSAYGVCVIMQPSTFFRKSIFAAVGGFNRKNLSNWDGELFVDMALKMARFARINIFLSAYRLQSESITSSKKLEKKIREYDIFRFKKIMGRERRWFDCCFYYYFKLIRYITNPLDIYERIKYGPIYGRIVE